MKRQPRNKQNRAVTNSRSLRIESLEDRKLLTVAAEMVQMPQESQIGSEHGPEPAAEITVGPGGILELSLHNNGAFRGPQETGFSRGLHNNGAFRDPAGHILWNASDDSETSSDSYTESGRITYYAYELKNVQVSSVVAPTNGQNQLNGDMIFTLHDSNVDKVFGENRFGGQEGEPVAEKQFSLNYEEIKVTYRDDVHDAKTETVCADEAGSQEDMKQESEANVEARLWQRVDRVMSRLTPGGLLGGEDEDPGQPSEDDLSVFGHDDDVTDPNYKEDEQGGPADPLNDPRQNDNDEDEDDESNEDERWKRMAEDWTRMLNHLSN